MIETYKLLRIIRQKIGNNCEVRLCTESLGLSIQVAWYDLNLYYRHIWSEVELLDNQDLYFATSIKSFIDKAKAQYNEAMLDEEGKS